MPRFLRARTVEEKQLRRQAILVAARKLAREVGPIELGLNELGRRSGVSKPNIYRYFESREEILLRLLIAELDDALPELETELLACAPTVRAVAPCLARTFLSRPLACQLLGMVGSILEHNLSADAIASCKLELYALIGRAGTALVTALPWLSVADAVWAAQNIALYVSALWPAAHPSKTAAEALTRPELAGMKTDAPRELGRFVEVVLAGLESLRPPARKSPTRSR